MARWSPAISAASASAKSSLYLAPNSMPPTPGPTQHELGDPLAVHEGEIDRHAAADRAADEVDGLEVERVDEAEHFGDRRPTPGRKLGTPEATHVGGDH